MSKINSGSVKLTGRITMKNLIYDFSDSANHKIIFPDSERRLEGKSFFSFDSQSIMKSKGKQTGMSVEITSLPVGSDLFIDNKHIGITPYIGNMIYGSHSLRIEYQGNKTEKVIQISHEGTDNFSLAFPHFTETAFDINLEMVFVEGGTFLIGSNDGEAREKPLYSVTLSDFYIGKYQVTQKQWRNVMGNNPSYFNGCDNHPVEQVSWDDVHEFIKRMNQKTGKNFRLPIDTEWEYAAKGGKQSRGYTYSGSNNLDDVGWYDSNSGKITHPVGQKQSNELELFDMSGNVFEWCNRDFAYNQYMVTLNPKLPSSISSRVLFGGAWNGSAQYCRTSDRCYGDDVGENVIGFRLVLVP